jgi:putative tricarboxylic transport membrane protein
MFEAFVQGWLQIFDPLTFALIWLGSIVGLIMGIIPGLTALVAMALALPFIFGLNPEVALPLMVAIASTGVTGGSITAILLNVPGTPPNAATLIDGFPMSQKGEGGRAIGAALTSSCLGGVLGVCMALPMVPMVLTFIMAFGSAELFALVVLGISFIGVLGSGSVTKGFISGLLGILISLIGFQASTGMSRFTFGSSFLYDGIGLIPFTMGLFAFPELIDLVQGKSITQQVKLGKEITKDLIEGLMDTFRHFWLFLRSNVIGFIIGLIPGIGGDVAVFVSYGQAVRTSRHPEKFGTGVVEGVIAPEAANNAKEGGALMCTLALGLPGSASMAILLGGFVAVGLAPGPGMLTEHLDLSFNLFLTTIVANIIGAGICFAMSRHLVKISYINADYLFPVISVFVFLGAFTHYEDLRNIIVVFVVGILGYCMKMFGYSRPALLLGFVLGYLFEKNFFISLGVYGPGFLLRPLVLGIFAIVIVIATYDVLKAVFQKLLGRDRRR